MAYREVAVRIGLSVIIAVMMLEVPGYMWLAITPEQKHQAYRKVAEQFKDDFPFCKIAKMWTVYVKETNSYQIWMRCIDEERRL